MNNQINELVKKAERSLDAARMLCKSGDHDFAISRAYYAMLYISEALLLTIGESYSKHQAVISGIYKHFVLNDKLPKEYHNIFHRSFDLRQNGDYLTGPMITKKQALSLIEDIEKQIEYALVLLKRG